MATGSVYSGMTGTSQTADMHSVTWKSAISFGKKKGKKGFGSIGDTKSSGSKTGGSASPQSKSKTRRNIKVGRIVLVVVLLVTAALLGVGSYYLMKTAETKLAKNRFSSIVQRAESNADWVMNLKKEATDSLAKMYGIANPDASEYPFVYMAGYQEVATKLKLITKGSSLSFCPIVRGFGEGSEQERFEEYYYNLYEEWGYPNATGESSFGKGIYGFGYDIVNQKVWPDYRYPILTNYTQHATPNPDNIMVPFVQSDYGYHSALMLDTQFEYNRFVTAKTVMKCSEERKLVGNTTIDCGSISDMIWQPTKAADVATGPTGMFYSPIYPHNDPFEITGFILQKQAWSDLIEQAFETDISGIRVVLYTDTGNEHTYDVRNGKVTYIGDRTHHCVKYATDRTEFVRQGDMEPCGPDDPWVPFNDLDHLYDSEGDFRALNISLSKGMFTDETVNYYMDIYATQEFVSHFGRLMGGETTDHSGLPISITVCIGTVCVMLFTSLLFFCYDYYVRQEFNAKNRLLEAKRQFVRFVSHEVRTPLNTVCMGLTLLENDLAAALEGNDFNKALKATSKSKSKSSGQAVNHHEKLLTSEESVAVGEGDIVVKKESVEDWLSLSTQVFQNADAAVGVLSDLLNYDKIQMGTLSLELSLMNLWVALEKTVEEFQMAATENSVSLAIDFSPLMTSSLLSSDKAENAESDGVEKSLPSAKSLKASDLPAKIRNCMVVGDKIRLTQVFRNLISNGLKFSKEQTQMIVRVSIDPLPDNKRRQENISLNKNVQAEVINVGSVSVEVIDQGVGMTNEQVDTVFEDGTQFNANQLQAGGGSGLGLNIARGIVIEHGGELSCSSEGTGKGTTFTLCTKLYMDKNSPSPAAEMADAKDMEKDEENAGDADFTVPLLRVLVVDDSLTNRKLCQRLLQRSGHTTEGASNGEEAVQMVKESLKTGNYYDSILLDYEMPVMNGPDACRLIRKMGCSSYIAGVTGNVMSEDVDHFRSCGANWVIPKPFSLKAMEDQWVEDGVTPFNDGEESMVRVESSQGLIEMGDDVAVNFDSKLV